MSMDVQFLTLCDHLVSDKQYRPDMCPRCLGKGYYLDIVFDYGGAAVVTGGGIKLQQEVIKVLLDERGSDLFFPKWGSEIHDFIGKKKSTVTKSRLEMAVRRAIEYLKQVQEYEAEGNSSMTDAEIIQNIEYVYLEPLSVTAWKVTVGVSNVANEYYEYSITL